MQKGIAMRSTTWWLGLSLLAAPAVADDFEQRVPAQPGGRLEVRLDGGTVEVEGHDEPEVRVEATTSGLGDGMQFTLESDGRDVSFHGRRRGVMSWLASPRVRVHIRVPQEFSLDIRTSGGEIDVESIVGALVARTSGGAVTASEIRGAVDLYTSGGRVRAEEIVGDLKARTSGGAVAISEVLGRIDAETSGGPMEVHEVSGPVKVRSSGGSISVRFSGEPAGEIRTSGGGIDLEFPEGLGLTLDAQTSGGGVDLDLPIALTGRLDRERVQGDVNGGGQRVELRTSGGSIQIRER